LAWARLSEATTAPVVGEMVREPSAFDTELTAPLPVPQAAPVDESLPVASAWTQVVALLPSEETTKSVVEPAPEMVRPVEEANCMLRRVMVEEPLMVRAVPVALRNVSGPVRVVEAEVSEVVVAARKSASAKCDVDEAKMPACAHSADEVAADITP